MSVALLTADAYLSGSPTPITAPPFTVNIWFKSIGGLGQNQTAWSVTNNTTNTELFRGFLADASANQLRYQLISGTGVQAEILGPYNANTWEMLTCVEAAANDHRVYWNGANRADTIASRVPVAVTQLAVGVNLRLSPQHYFRGYLAEVSIWNGILSDAEVLDLYNNNTIPSGRIWYASYKTSFTSELGITLSPGGVGTPSISPDHPPVDGPGPPPDTPVPYTAWQPALLRDCWTTPNGVDLKRSHTTDSYSGGNPSAATDLKSSIVDYATGNLKSGLTVRGNIKSSILKPT